METEEEVINMDEEFSYFEYITEFIQSNGWYFLSLAAIIAYLYPKLRIRYLKWSEQRAEAKMKKNPDLLKPKPEDLQKTEELQKARIKFQEEYEKKAKIALEKQNEKQKKILEEKQALLNSKTTGKSYTEKSKNPKPDYNPLMGSGSGSNYRPPRRSPCSGGRCG